MGYYVTVHQFNGQIFVYLFSICNFYFRDCTTITTSENTIEHFSLKFHCENQSQNEEFRGQDFLIDNEKFKSQDKSNPHISFHELTAEPFLPKS